MCAAKNKRKPLALLPLALAVLLAISGAFGTWLALTPTPQNFDGATRVSVQNLDANVRTIAATVNASPTISVSRVAGIVLPAEAGGWGLYLSASTRFLCFGKIGVSEACSSQSVTLGTSHHVAASYDGSTVNLYIDGVLSGSKPLRETFATKDAPYFIGGTRYEKWGSDNFFVGSIRNVRAYSSVLDATQIAVLARGKLSNAESTLIGNWLGDGAPPAPVCGDGICQNAVCLGTNCPAPEKPGTCPQDCGSCPLMICPPTEPGCRYESTGKDANGCENTCGKLVCDEKKTAYCGDGICQNAVCLGTNCPAPEKPGTCPQDCGSCPLMICPPTEPGCRYESTGKDANGCENTCGKLVCDEKKTAYCGDGLVQNGEQCDDKNRKPGDGCNGQCMKEFCGDRIVTPSQQEQCDDGSPASGDGCSATCAFEYCGDSAVQAALGETCDDGNLLPGDGCDQNCATERKIVPPPTTASSRSAATSAPAGPVCGDGICQNAVCLGTNCPAPEKPGTCPQDCKAPPTSLRVPNGVSDDLFGGAVPNVGDTLSLRFQENVDHLSFPSASKYFQAVSDDLRKKAIVNNGAIVIMNSQTGQTVNVPNPTLPNDADPTYNNALHSIDLFGGGNLDYLLMNVRYTRKDTGQLATAALRYVLTGGKYTYSIFGYENAVPSANGKFAYVGNVIMNLENGSSRKFIRPSLGPEDGWSRPLSISNDGTKIAFEGYAIARQANGTNALTATLILVNTSTNAVSRFVPALSPNEYATVGAYVLSGDFSKIFLNSTRSMRSGTTTFVAVRPYVLDPATGAVRSLLGNMHSALESPSYPYGYLYGPAVDSASANGNRVLLRAHIYRNRDEGGLQTTPEYWAYDLPTQKFISLTAPLEGAAPNKFSTPLGLAPDGQTVLMKNENDNLVALHTLISAFQ